VEVDHATALVLRNLGVLHRGHLPEPVGRDLEGVGEGAAQGDRAPAPQVRCPPLPHHLRGVVVAVAAQRLPEQRIVLAVGALAGRRPAVQAADRAAGVRVAAGAGGRPAVHGPE
jgi:hypothetical protein